jgi:hypothetical protein
MKTEAFKRFAEFFLRRRLRSNDDSEQNLKYVVHFRNSGAVINACNKRISNSRKRRTHIHDAIREARVTRALLQ